MPAPCSARRTSACSRASTSAGCRCSAARAVGVLSTGDELVESGALSPGKIRDANRPMLLALLEQAGVEAVEPGHGARRRSRDDRDARGRARTLRRGDHEWRRVGRRLRLHERHARTHRRRRSRRPLTGRLVPGGDPSGEAALLRGRARPPGLRASGQPGLVARELRALRATGAPDDDGTHRVLPHRGHRARGARVRAQARRQAAPRPRDRASGRRPLRRRERRQAGEQHARGDGDGRRARAPARRRRRRAKATTCA